MNYLAAVKKNTPRDDVRGKGDAVKGSKQYSMSQLGITCRGHFPLKLCRSAVVKVSHSGDPVDGYDVRFNSDPARPART
jgi:hypothetical protein